MSASNRHTVFNVKDLRSAIATGWQPTFLYFWGHQSRTDAPGKHVLSQWWPAPFTIDGQTYATAEHYMMAEKARLSSDMSMRARIVGTTDPRQAKALGREVRGFDAELWKQHRFEVVVRGNASKFNQNPALGAWLVDTGNSVLVEASPVDSVWGIGLIAEDPRAEDPTQWRGSNLLGFALMRVRMSLDC